MPSDRASNPIPPLPTKLSDRWTSEYQYQALSGYEDGLNRQSGGYRRPISSASPRRKPVSSQEVKGSYEQAQQTSANPAATASPGSGRQDLRARATQLPRSEGFSRQQEQRPRSFQNTDHPDSNPQMEPTHSLPIRNRNPNFPVRSRKEPLNRQDVAVGNTHARNKGHNVEQSQGLQYYAFEDEKNQRLNSVSEVTAAAHSRQSSASESDPQVLQRLEIRPSTANSRPTSSHSDPRGRTFTPFSAHSSEHGSPRGWDPDHSHSRRSPSARPTSYVSELNHVPYSQQIAPGGTMEHKSLEGIVGSGASLLDTRKTIEMYRSNIKKDTEPSVQYEFAILMVNTAREAEPDSGLDSNELITEAKHILQRLADRAYPFAQYYLGDGYFSGLFNKDKPDHEKAFSYFLAASKHGHAEAGYRAALCYEFGWGTNKSYPKASQFYRTSASKNHPGAATRLGLACLNGEMGLGRDRYREGVKWLKRSQESADFQYNSAPYELGVLHLTGYGDDIFKDEVYAAQLFTQSADLGHPEANFLMGQAYETGLYGCPRDAALSVHFYNGAATKGHPDAMMALCAWYMVGAEPVLEKDEGEAYEWALRAAETGYAKAEYAVGYFTEIGIGCRRDILQANVWYVRAADQDYQRAKQRLQVIRAAAAGSSNVASGKLDGKSKDKKKFMGLF